MVIDIDTLLAWGGVYKQVAPGDVIFTEGSECYYYHQVVSGLVRWVNIDEEGREYIQTLIEKGECFGEIPLFDNEPYAATAIAEENVIQVNKQKCPLPSGARKHRLWSNIATAWIKPTDKNQPHNDWVAVSMTRERPHDANTAPPISA
jgi:hypothetical protein